MSNSVVLTLLKIVAVLAALLGVWQTLVGFGWVSGFGMHGRLGETTFVVLLVATVLAFVWSRRSGDKGLLMHAGGMAVLALVQVGIGMIGMRIAHMVLGVLFLLGALALATLSLRRSPALADGHAREIPQG